MAIANLQETINSYILRRNALDLELVQLREQKSLATYSQGDINSQLSLETQAIRTKYKEIFEANEEYYKNDLKYADYTEIPEFEEEIEMMEAKYQEDLEELNAWETIIEQQIASDDTELEEVNAYLESYKTMLNENVTDDFSYGLDS